MRRCGRDPRLLTEVAASVDAPAAIVPHLSELFADLTSLGSAPRRVVSWLESAGIGAGSRVVDLGCGKGAAAVEAARRLGCGVVGVDAFAPFVEAARELAGRRGVAELCRFVEGDYRDTPRRRERFDAGLMLGVAPVGRAAALLHRVVRPGGVYIIDDAVWLGDPAEADGVPTLEEARGVFEGLGDALEREHVLRPSEVRAFEDRMHARIARRARGIGRGHPELRETLREFLAMQRRAIRVLQGPLRPVLWMVRRG